MNNMEIKKGDKVRVSKDAPKIYTKDGFNLATKMDFEVVEIEDECARIENADGILTMAYVLPTKYLVKVDAEAKEAKFKVGDIIDTPKGKGTVHIAIDDYCVVRLDNGEWFVHMETNIPYAPCTEPTEQTEKKSNVGSIKIPVEVDLSDSYWAAYTADLARDIAVKSMEKSYGCDPERIADYAVSVAKAVVEELKGK